MVYGKYIYIISVVAFILFVRLYEYHSLKKIKKQGEIHSCWTLMSLKLCLFFVLVFCVLEVLLRKEVFIASCIAGFVLYFISYFLRRAVRVSLGSYWSWNIEIREDHRLIRSGPYKFCRHPNYVAVVIEAVGVAFIFNAYWTLIGGLLILVPLLALRVRLEEHAMVQKFGAEYERYRETTKAFVPGLI